MGRSMMRNILLVSFLVALVVLAACDGNKNKGRSAKDVQDVFLGGTQGLAISFEENRPPKSIITGTSGEVFTVGVQLLNKGEVEVPADKVKVRLAGLNPVTVGVANPVISPDGDIQAREKVSDEVIEPALVYARYNGLKYTTEVSSSTDIIADVCYPYETKVRSRLCVLEDPRGPGAEDKVCNFAEAVPTANSGAPLQVTDVKEMPRVDKIRFLFTIAKVDGSDTSSVYKQGTNCFPDALADKQKLRDVQDWVLVEVNAADKLRGLSCAGFQEKVSDTSGYVLLGSDGKSSSLYCEFSVADATTDFAEFIDLALKYQYKESVKMTVTLES